MFLWKNLSVKKSFFLQTYQQYFISQTAVFIITSAETCD